MLDLWQKLSADPRPLVLYGMGNGAERVLKQLNTIGRQPVGIFASDAFVRGQSFCGYTVERYTSLAERYPNMVILVCFGSGRTDVFYTLETLALRHTVYCPDVPVYGDTVFDMEFARQNREKLQRVYQLLGDEQSKNAFEGIIRFKLSGEFSFLREIETDEGLFSPVQPLCEEIYVDLGAYRGDTIEEFLSCCNDYQKIYGVEPNAKTFRKLEQNFGALRDTTLLCAAISDHDGVVCVDSDGRGTSVSGTGKEVPSVTLNTVVASSKVTLIKMDVEGQEAEAIRGGADLIRLHKPKLIVAGYHRSEDIFDLPLLIHSLCPEYKILLRHSPHNLAWDTNFYFI